MIRTLCFTDHIGEMSSCSLGLAQSHCNLQQPFLFHEHVRGPVIPFSWPSRLLPSLLLLPDALFSPPSSGSQQCAMLRWSKDARLYPEMYIILPSLRPDPGVNSPHSSEEAVETERSQMSKLWWMKSDEFGFFPYFSARLLVVFFFFNGLNLHLVVLSSKGPFFFLPMMMFSITCIALIIVWKCTQDLQTSFTQVQNINIFIY